MNKLEFINGLGSRLDPIPRDEIQTILDYYVESVADRMEDGMTEEEAIESFGDLDQLAANILVEQGYLAPPRAPEPVSAPTTELPNLQSAPTTELPTLQPAAKPEPKKRFPWWAIVLLVLGSPIWLSLGIAAAAVVLTVYIVVLALLFSLWCIAVSFTAAGIAGAVLSFFAPFTPDTFAIRLLSCGACLVLVGIGILLLPVCRAASDGFARLHKKVWNKIRRKEEEKA